MNDKILMSVHLFFFCIIAFFYVIWYDKKAFSWRGKGMIYNMYSEVMSCGLVGIQGVLIRVEADVRDGLPSVSMVGSLSASVRESKDRVITAIKNIGIPIPPKRITINFSPADLKKEGTAFDLPIAIAILSSYGYFPNNTLQEQCFFGEIGLNGDIKPVKGILSMVAHAKEQGLAICFVPYGNRYEASIMKEIQICPVKTLKEVIFFLQNPTKRKIWNQNFQQNQSENFEEESDFLDVFGQHFAKRGAEICAAGRHNYLLLGPPGSGKSMIASRIPSLMPKLTMEEGLELTKIYSVKGELKEEAVLMTKRPFRAPHHTITEVGLIGGGYLPKPGEITMAHTGVLFLDEFPEFSRSTLEVLRQPLEEKKITLTRRNHTITYPADILLLGAMNPCPCGYYPNLEKCHCTPLQMKSYLNRISHPLLERIDLMAEVTAVSYDDLQGKGEKESSEKMKKRVEHAVSRQKERYKKMKIGFNGQLQGKAIEKFCSLDKKGEKLLQYVFEQRNWSARTYYRVLKVARTIADLEQSDEILEEHLIEAIAYRGLEEKYWGQSYGI